MHYICTEWFLDCPTVLWGKLIICMICFLYVCAMWKHWRVELWQTRAHIPLVCRIKSQKKLTNVTFHTWVVPLCDYHRVGKIHRMIYSDCLTAERWPYHEMRAYFKLQVRVYSHGQRLALISLALSLSVSIPLISVSSPQWGWLNRP